MFVCNLKMFLYRLKVTIEY